MPHFCLSRTHQQIEMLFVSAFISGTFRLTESRKIRVFWWTYFTAEAIELKLQLSHYPVSLAISEDDETWICLTYAGQHKGLNSKQGTRGPSWRQAQLRSTSQSPPAYCCSPSPTPPNITTTLCPSPSPATNPSSSSTPLWQASSASRSYPSPTLNICPVHLSCPSNSMWRQQCGLSCEHPFHSVAALQSSRFLR